MSTNCYRIAFDHAANEMTEIDAQIERLTRRKQLLEKLLEPLQILLREPGASGFSASQDATPTGTVALIEMPEHEPGSFNPAALTMQPEMEEASIEERRNRISISHEDVAGLAYQFWNERGQVHGYHEDDWYRAANKLQN